MTISEMVSAIQQIQAQLAALNGTSSTSASSTSGTGSTSASSFASALTSATDDSTASTATGQDVVDDALKYVGVPYVLGGESTSGMDCSGLVQKVFSDLGVKVPRLVHEQATVGTKVDSLKDAKPGDIITLNGNDHVVIYMGNNTVIHAPYAGRTVSVQKVWFDQSDITSIRRIVPSTSSTTSTSGTSSVSAGTTAAELSAATQLSALTGDTSDISSLLSGSSTSGSSDLSSLLGGSTSTSTSSTSNYLSSLLNSMGVTGTTGSSTAAQLLAARAALLQDSAS